MVKYSKAKIAEIEKTKGKLRVWPSRCIAGHRVDRYYDVCLASAAIKAYEYIVSTTPVIYK